VPLVRCPQHGRIYDSDKERGCPLCLAMGPADHRAQSREQQGTKPPASVSWMLAIFVLAMVVAGVVFAWKWHEKKVAEEAAAALRARQELIAPTQPDTSHFAPANDLTPIRRARALAATLADIMGDNRAALLRFGTGPIDTADTNRTARRRSLEYATFARRWHARLDDATRSGHDFRYAPGVQYSLQMEQVTNQLSAALAVERDMVPFDHVKALSDRREDLVAASGYLNGARTVLTNLPSTPAPRPAPRRTTTHRSTTTRRH
jgi:hypothetical protein